MSDSSVWRETFSQLFQASVAKYHAGHYKALELVDAIGRTFLASLGYTEQEFFDFIEDFAKQGVPTLETAVEIAAVRRDYFLNEQHGVLSPHRIDMSMLPSKDAEVAGIGWLPRLIPKAQAKLRGEMPPELMYGCGGDRKFFRTNSIDPAEFLRQVWHAGGNTQAVVDWVAKTRRVVES